MNLSSHSKNIYLHIGSPSYEQCYGGSTPIKLDIYLCLALGTQDNSFNCVFLHFIRPLPLKIPGHSTDPRGGWPFRFSGISVVDYHHCCSLYMTLQVIRFDATKFAVSIYMYTTRARIANSKRRLANSRKPLVTAGFFVHGSSNEFARLTLRTWLYYDGIANVTATVCNNSGITSVYEYIMRMTVYNLVVRVSIVYMYMVINCLNVPI